MLRVEVTRAVGARRRSPALGAALLTAVTVFLVVAVVSAAVFLVWPNGSSASASFIPIQPGALSWDGHSRITALLLGLSDGAPPAAEMQMVVSYDPATKRTAVLSLPPDLWVTIPGYGQGRISEAYGDGGPRLALVTVESVVHIPIPYYIAVPASTFSRVVDAVGGVDLHLGGAARRHVNGTGALALARQQPSDAPGDTAQMQRQQALLLALEHQAFQPQTVFQLPALITALGGSVHTNFPYNQALGVIHALMNVPAGHLRMAELDSSNGCVASFGGAAGAVLMPDWQHIQTLAQTLFAPSNITTSPIEVVNGAGVPGQAQSLASWLAAARLNVSGYNSANAFNFAATFVAVRPGASERDRATAAAVGALLQVPVVSRAERAGSSRVVVIIGHDFQDPTQQ